MLHGKRNRKQNKKYSDFVQLPLTKSKSVKTEHVSQNKSVGTVEINAETPHNDDQQEYCTPKAEPASPFIIKALSSLMYTCPHHDLLVTTSDRSLVPCHALMLSQASPVLSRVLKDQEVQEGGMMSLVIENMNKEQFSCLLEFVYTGQTKAAVPLELIDRFTELDILFSVEACENIKAENLDIDHEEFKLDNDLENWEANDRKNTIVQSITLTENKENQEDYSFDEGNVIKAGSKVCDFCGSDFSSFILLKRHVRDQHQPDYNIFLDNFGLLERFKCDYCYKGFKTYFRLRTHLLNCHGDEWESFCKLHKNHECLLCEKKFFSKEEVSKHERRVHKRFKTRLLPNGKHVSGRPVSVNIDDGLPVNHERRCNLCEKVFSNSEKFTDHMNAHFKGEKPYHCEFCGFRSVTRKTLKKHSLLHYESATPLLCNACGDVFKCQYDLKQHKKHSHNHRLVGRRKVKSKSKSISEFICEKCGQHFIDQQKYNSHIKFSHISEEDKLQCPHCPHKSMTQFSLKMHLALHYPPTLPCEKCGKLFHTKLYLTRHIKQNHADESEKDFQCAQCGKGFVTRDSYEGHLSMHAGVKPIKCRYCDMRYQNRSNAIAHEKKAHKDLYTRKTKSLGGVRVKDRMAGKEIIGLNKITSDIPVDSVFYIVENKL